MLAEKSVCSETDIYQYMMNSAGSSFLGLCYNTDMEQHSED